MSIHNDPERRHDFVLLFDCTDGNPNGDPDAGNLPRVDPETMQGLVTDVAIKRKVRDFVGHAGGDSARNKIYVERGAVLNERHERAYEATRGDSEETSKRVNVSKARSWMCHNFYDVRMFGAMMSTGVNCGQVRGPLQLTFARSVDPITPMDLSITRVAVTKAEDADKQTTMGRKTLIPYGLYMARGFFTPEFASDTGVDASDLELFWRSLQMMWDLDRSATRGFMSCRGIHVFSHDHRLGNAPAHKLFDRVKVTKREGVGAARAFSDYDVRVDAAELPDGVTLTTLS